LAEYRKKGGEKLAEFLGDGKFFGGDKPSIGDFWVAGHYFGLERNTIKNDNKHVYAACNAAMPAPLAAWMDRMTEELKDYIADRPATAG
jgi:glutathione S-transferase